MCYVCIYIYIERERERVYIYIYIYAHLFIYKYNICIYNVCVCVSLSLSLSLSLSHSSVRTARKASSDAWRSRLASPRTAALLREGYGLHRWFDVALFSDIKLDVIIAWFSRYVGFPPRRPQRKGRHYILICVIDAFNVISISVNTR